MACSADLALGAAAFIEQLPGAQPIYRVHSGDGGKVFAAKWRLVDIDIPPAELSDAFVACRMAGTATILRRRSDVSTRRRPTIGSVTYVDGRSPAGWRIEGSCDVWHVYMSIDALRRFAEGKMGLVGAPPIVPFFAMEEPWLKGFFQMLASEFEKSGAARQSADPLFTGQAEHLLINHLLRSHSEQLGATSGAPPLRGTHALRGIVLKRVQEYVAANLGRDIDLDELADVACMSIGHFVRSFRSSAGVSPYRYVLEQRLSRARELLRTTSLSVSDIATECGFKTTARLSARFHAKVGATPTQFRNYA
jgi:AraC family transcriptional regulator